MLQLLVIGLGQVAVTVEGVCEACDGFRLQKAVDKPVPTTGTLAPGATGTVRIKVAVQ